jgi:hypothetical protein
MANMNVTPQQIQMAASAGVQLLQVDDLPVPLIIAKGGALSILESFLGSIARGELILTEPPKPEEAPVDPDEEGKGKGKLKSVQDDKVN